MRQHIKHSPHRTNRRRRLRRLTTKIAVGLLLIAGASAITASPGSGATGEFAIARYAPVLYLAPGERFLPVDATRFVAESSLKWAHDQGCPDSPGAKRGEVDASRLGSGGYRDKIANGLCFEHGPEYASNDLTRPRQEGKDGVPLREGFFLNFPNRDRVGGRADVPVFYEFEPGRYITYWFFYAFNNAPGPTNIFDHEGDWERISVQLDGDNRARTVAYYQHEGYCTLPWHEAKKRDGHPLAFSALGTHATYQRVGRFPIAHGLATDKTGRGHKWTTADNLRDARAQGWFGYGGAWGEVGDGPDSTGPLGPSRYKDPAPEDWTRRCE